MIDVLDVWDDIFVVGGWFCKYISMLFGIVVCKEGGVGNLV